MGGTLLLCPGIFRRRQRHFLTEYKGKYGWHSHPVPWDLQKSTEIIRVSMGGIFILCPGSEEADCHPVSVKVLRIRDPALFYPLDPESESRMNFFRVPDSAPLLEKFSYIIFRILVTVCYGIFMKLG
jgi:hypothetical protein